MRSPLTSWVRRSRDTAPRGIPNQALQLSAPMGRDLGISVQGKALHAGTAGSRQRAGPRRLCPARLLTVAAPWARRPLRLAQRLGAIGLAWGGKAGAHLS